MNGRDDTHEHDERDEIVEVYEWFANEEEALVALAARRGHHIHQMNGRWALVSYLPLECAAGMMDRDEDARLRKDGPR